MTILQIPGIKIKKYDSGKAVNCRKETEGVHHTANHRYNKTKQPRKALAVNDCSLMTQL